MLEETLTHTFQTDIYPKDYITQMPQLSNTHFYQAQIFIQVTTYDYSSKQTLIPFPSMTNQN